MKKSWLDIENIKRALAAWRPVVETANEAHECALQSVATFVKEIEPEGDEAISNATRDEIVQRVKEHFDDLRAQGRLED